MLAFLLSEVAFFTTLIVVYISFLHRDRVGPTPAEALSLPLVIGTTICLLSSSLVDPSGRMAIERGRQRHFCLLWAGTIALGHRLSGGTVYEWRELVRSARADDQPQSVRHDVLYARRLSRAARYGRSDRDACRAGLGDRPHG